MECREDKSKKSQEKHMSSAHQKNDNLANRKSEHEKENEKDYEMRHYSAIRHFLRGHCIKSAVYIDDGFHVYKINMSNSKKQEVNLPISDFHWRKVLS